MGEANNNPQALLAKTLPAAMLPGREISITIGTGVEPARHIVLIQAEKMRPVINEPQVEKGANVQDTIPSWEVQDSSGAWMKLPQGMRAHRLGEPLAPEDCDLVIYLCPVVVDKTLVAMGGNYPISQGPRIAVASLNLAKFQAAHESTLSGQDPKKGLVLV